MRRSELIHAVREVTNALDTSKVEGALELLMRSARTRQTGGASQVVASLLRALKYYSVQAEAFTPAARKLTEIFELRGLQDPDVWSALFADQQSVASGFAELRWDVHFTKQHLPRVVSLLQQDSLPAEGTARTRRVGTEEFSSLSVILVEQGDRLSTPERLIELLTSINEMYEACATVIGLPPGGLVVAAMDSGSDKSFDLLGIARVIECVKEVIISLWDRVVFFREKQLAQRIELVAQALPVITQIDDLEKQNKLGREQAEVLRRQIVHGVSKFLESGAYIPEIADRTFNDPRLLMAPEPKLLGSGPVASCTEEAEPTQKVRNRPKNGGTKPRKTRARARGVADGDENRQKPESTRTR